MRAGPVHPLHLVHQSFRRQWIWLYACMSMSTGLCSSGMCLSYSQSGAMRIKLNKCPCMGKCIGLSASLFKAHSLAR